MKQLPPFSLADLSIGKWALHYKQAGITFRFFMLLCVAFYLCIGFSLHKLYGIQVICYSSALKTIDITGFFKKFCITTRTNKSSLKRQVSASFFLQYGKSGNIPVTLTPKRQNDCARTAEIFNSPGAFCG